MFKSLSTPLLLALLSLPAASFAQSTEAESPAAATEEAPKTETTEATENAAPQADPAEGLSLGEEAQPEPYARETFGDWALQCLRIPGQEDTSKEPCQLFQALKDPQGGNVAEVTLFKLPSGGKAIAGANILVPLETMLTEPVTIAVDGGKARRYPYQFCSPIGCFARIGFTAQDINAMKKGANASVTIVPAVAPDQKVKLNMSLSGFTAGYDAVSVMQ